ncbi:hypothetical protein ASPSYDRAFT_47134 [Aspergillus sydowii CBS 593.65]|uniref:Uncharacterized protein n=1 Tax=Aspergillus sydowii CBS 593.65 TaxID=1036612 RepID=A0A1L9TBQ2_9EURO|nr:uncharacterized protein ASPSYDRAFT_47134 [Aspergillus sydowii CBS 593.65]OJJ56858.1 hypothetical protein ASPSYDRAFT_47134 [Aspergillus sydowii CBS 593.65]
MKFLKFSVPLISLLPVLATAAPLSDPVEGTGLEKRRKAQTCKIINVDHYVNCRYEPYLDAGEIFGFPNGDKLTFACYKKGDCFNGVCTWDQITYLGTTCYVNGYFTDSNCSSKKLPKC